MGRLVIVGPHYRLPLQFHLESIQQHCHFIRSCLLPLLMPPPPLEPSVVFLWDCGFLRKGKRKNKTCSACVRPGIPEPFSCLRSPNRYTLGHGPSLFNPIWSQDLQSGRSLMLWQSCLCCGCVRGGVTMRSNETYAQNSCSYTFCHGANQCWL